MPTCPPPCAMKVSQTELQEPDERITGLSCVPAGCGLQVKQNGCAFGHTRSLSPVASSLA